MSVSPEAAAAARRWLQWADEDWTMADAASRDATFVPRGVCMWSHQAGEKAVKALLCAHDIDPPKQHDLSRLVQRLPERDRDLLDGIDIDELSRWAIEGRYPDDFDEASTAEAATALKLAHEVMTRMRVQIGVVIGEHEAE